MSLYSFILLIHILSAILGMGPGFVMIYVISKATNLSELKHAYIIRNRLHQFVMIGGTFLILSGITMGIMQPYLFQRGWYVSSIVLFLIGLSFGPFVLAPKSKPIKELLNKHTGETIPEAYYPMAKKLFFYERIENGIFILIIILMVLKPF
ncbi:MAG: DUF2269 family protein [Bacteroidia bacterium]|nr:DUF2269 family protein [Bacteroidia bacterium]